MYKNFLAYFLSLSLLLGTSGFGVTAASAQTPRPPSATSDQQAMDNLLAPIALYPDALLAQVLAAASSPQQVTEVNKWLQDNSQLQGTDLQQAAEQAGYDAAFIALVLFPDVLKLMQDNLDWTTELGKAFSSDQKAVLDSVQRLRAQAQAVGNLKTTPQQEVTTETQSGQQVIVIQPANPQIVYVPVYNPQVVYVSSPPPSSGDVAAAAIIGFGLGIALGVAMSNSYYGYYGWGAWGMHWNTRVVVVHGGVWRVPPYHRYPYARPVPYYRPPVHVVAPRYSSVNVNINNVNVNRNNVNVNGNGRTPRPTTLPAGTSPIRPNNNSATTMPNRGNVGSNSSAYPRPTTNSTPSMPNRGNGNASATSPTRSSTARPPTASENSNDISRGRTPNYSGTTPSKGSTSNASPVRQMEKGAPTSAFSGYQKGSSEQAAAARGRSSASSASGKGRPGK